MSGTTASRIAWPGEKAGGETSSAGWLGPSRSRALVARGIASIASFALCAGLWWLSDPRGPVYADGERLPAWIGGTYVVLVTLVLPPVAIALAGPLAKLLSGRGAPPRALVPAGAWKVLVARRSTVGSAVARRSRAPAARAIAWGLGGLCVAAIVLGMVAPRFLFWFFVAFAWPIHWLGPVVVLGLLVDFAWWAWALRGLTLHTDRPVVLANDRRHVADVLRRAGDRGLVDEMNVYVGPFGGYPEPIAALAATEKGRALLLEAGLSASNLPDLDAARFDTDRTSASNATPDPVPPPEHRGTMPTSARE